MSRLKSLPSSKKDLFLRYYSVYCPHKKKEKKKKIVMNKK